MSGTLNGAPIQSYTDFDFDATIFNNNFQYITVQHGGKGCALARASSTGTVPQYR